MSGLGAIEALRGGLHWTAPILMPSAAAFGARLEARPLADLAEPQALAGATVAAARFLGADAVWVSAAPAAGLTLSAAAHRDAVTRAAAAAGRLKLAVLAEIPGPIARARALGGDLDAALREIKPGLIEEFEALSRLRPDIIVLREPAASGEEAANRSLPRLYGALKRLAEHFDILKGMWPALPEMTGPARPDLSFAPAPDAPEAGPVTGERALAIAPDWSDAPGFGAALQRGRGAAAAAGLPLIVSGCAGLAHDTEPQLARAAIATITERA